MPKRMMLIYAGLIAATVGLFWITPSGFIPAQDQGYFLTVIQLPPGSSLERTDAVMRKVAARILPIPGVKGSVMLAGFDGASQTRLPTPQPPMFRCNRSRSAKAGVTLQSIMAEAQAHRRHQRGAAADRPAPAHPGHGSAGGYRMIVEDRTGHSFQELSGQSWGLIAKANQTPGLKQVYTLFDIVPRAYSPISTAEGRYAGRSAAADFRSVAGLSGLCLHQRLQPARPHVSGDCAGGLALTGVQADIANLRTRSNSGAMVPIGSVATFQDRTGPYRVLRYNGFPAVEIDGDTAPGYSSGQSLKTMEKLAAETLPAGYAQRMDRHRLPASGRKHRGNGFRDRGDVRLPGAGRAI